MEYLKCLHIKYLSTPQVKRLMVQDGESNNGVISVGTAYQLNCNFKGRVCMSIRFIQEMTKEPYPFTRLQVSRGTHQSNNY